MTSCCRTFCGFESRMEANKMEKRRHKAGVFFILASPRRFFTKITIVAVPATAWLRAA